jgi:antitoxin (DNA-binding transcriptional repressor) of toxin-antitoxin stability system
MTTTVNLAEAREQLPDLIRRIAGGERVLLCDGEKPVAMLAPVPPHLLPPDPVAEAEAEAREEEAIRAIVQTWIDDGYPPEPDSPLWEIMGRRP